MESNTSTKMAVLLIVGLVIGVGAGYMMAPREESGYGSSYKIGYDEGFEDGFAEGKSSISTTDSTGIEEKVDGLTTLVYGAIGASLIAALAAIVSLMQISQRMS